MKQSEIKLTLPIPISINKAYAGYPRRHKSQDYKDWEQIAHIELMKQTTYNIKGDNWLEAVLIFYTPLYYKNGKKKKEDIDNWFKVLFDFLGKNIEGFDDSKIKILKAIKQDSDIKKVDIIIKEI